MENFRELLIEMYQQTNQFGKMLGIELTKFEEDGIEGNFIRYGFFS